MPGGGMVEGRMTLGQRIRELRREIGMTIQQLASLSGVPVSTISKIENGQLNPSLVQAINLATALEANLGFLVDRFRGGDAPYAIVRAHSREEIRFEEMGVRLQDVGGRFMPGILEARLGRIDAGAHSGHESMTHPGEEFCLVLEGTLDYCIAGEDFRLEAGDSIHFECDVPHSWSNPLSRETVVLWVFSDALSF